MNDKLYEKYKRLIENKKLSVILDSNLFVLLVVGSVDRSSITKNKRTDVFDERCFDFIVNLISNKTKLIVTTGILTEVSNLLIPGRAKEGRTSTRYLVVDQYRRNLVSLVQDHIHADASAIMVLDDAEFNRLGYCDMSILKVIDDATVVVSVDLDLINQAESRGIASINFNHLREVLWSA